MISRDPFEGHWSGHLFDCWCQEHFLADRNMKQAENVGHPKKCRGGPYLWPFSCRSSQHWTGELGTVPWGFISWWTLLYSKSFIRFAYRYVYVYMRVEQKVLDRGLHCEGPGVCIYHSRLTFFPEMAKYFFYWLKIWRKFRYMWYVYLSRPMFKRMFTRKEGHGNPKHTTFVSFVLPMTSGPWAFCECIGEFENVPIYYIGLSFAKVWRKFC